MKKTAATTGPLKKLTKKDSVKLIMNKLEPVLAEYKNSFGKKEFQSKLKKAGKLFGPAIARKAGKKNKLQVAAP